MRVLIISKHLLDLKDAQSQQSFAFLKAIQDIPISVDIITAITNQNELLYIKKNLNKNTNIFLVDAIWVENGNTIIKKIKRKLQRNLIATIKTKWVKKCIELANDLDKEHNYSTIITIGLPIESHMVGLGLNDKNKWISSFSDPWPESIMPKPYSDYSLPIFNYLQKKIVQHTLSQSKFIIFTCKQSRALFLKHYNFDIRKTLIIQHIAPELTLPQKNNDQNFIITHAGSLSRERFCPDLFYAIAELPIESKIIFKFIGYVYEDAKTLIEQLNIQHRVILIGQLAKEDTLESMKISDAFLLIEAKMEIYPFLPSKIADYSAFNLPIFAITGKDSSIAEIITLTNSGYLALHNKDEILQGLLTMEKNTFTGNRQNNLYQYFRKENIQEKLMLTIKELKKQSQNKISL